MHALQRAFHRFAARSFWRSEDGGVTVEYVLWLPLWASIMALMADSTVLYQERTQLFLSARDMARQVAIGAKTTEEAQTMVASAFTHVPNFNASITADAGFVTARLSAPMSSFTMFAGRFGTGTISADVVLKLEQHGEI